MQERKVEIGKSTTTANWSWLASSYFFLDAFSAALVTIAEGELDEDVSRKVCRRTLATLTISLLNGLDNTNSNGLPHVSDGKATKRRVFVVGFHAHRLTWDKFDNGSITRLDEFRGGLHHFTSSTVNLLD